MALSLPKHYNNKIVKAVAEFNLIEDGDRVVVGLSGGKDSSFLLYALVVLRQNLAVDFTLSAVTVDLGFDGTDFSVLEEYCRQLGVPFHLERTGIAHYIRDASVDNPCARCSYLRKGAIASYMQAGGFNKLALGHHYNDAVETFLMSIVYSGQILALQPQRHLSRSDVYIIRPLIYLQEKHISTASKLTGFEPLDSPCPYDGQTVRAVIKELTRDKQVFYNLAAAMRKGVPVELWPEEPPHEQVAARMRELWQGSS